MRRALLVILLFCAAPASALAQCLPPLLPPEEQRPCTEKYPSWTGELAALGANAVLGGVSAGVLQKLNGGSFSDGFLRGLAGGAVIYGGKRIAVERFGGAGLVGREVAAVGASMVRNAGDGMPAFERIVLPIGPARLYVQRGGLLRVRADLLALGWTAWALAEPEVTLDWGMSLSAGTPVFLTDDRIILTGSDSAHASGVVEAGVVFIADVPAFGRGYARASFAHERMHVLQMDQIFLTITDPLEDAVLRRLPGIRRIEPYADVNLSTELLRIINSRIPKHLDRPWETEAIFFTSR